MLLLNRKYVPVKQAVAVTKLKLSSLIFVPVTFFLFFRLLVDHEFILLTIFNRISWMCNSNIIRYIIRHKECVKT